MIREEEGEGELNKNEEIGERRRGEGKLKNNGEI